MATLTVSLSLPQVNPRQRQRRRKGDRPPGHFYRAAGPRAASADCYTATGFANPARRVLATVLHTRSEVRPLLADPTAESAAGETAETAAGSPVETLERRGPRLGYTSDVVEVTEAYLYRPMVRPVMATVRAAKRLQSGRLDAYLAYMLIALVALLALFSALA